jgi:hypothetical protein
MNILGVGFWGISLLHVDTFNIFVKILQQIQILCLKIDASLV